MNRDSNNERNRRRLFQQNERYQNDDYSRYSGGRRQSEYDSDYGGNYGTNPFDYRESGTEGHPGVSGKSRDQETWINPREYDQQRSLMGKGPKGYKRSDDRIYEEVCDALMRSHEVNATEIGVKVTDGIVTLEGKVNTRQEKRMAEITIEDLPGVLDVRNENKLAGKEGQLSGHEGAVKKDLGVDLDQSAREA